MQQVVDHFQKYFPYIAPVGSFVALVIVLTKTNPLEAGPAGILLIFVLLYLFISTSFYLLLTLILMLLAYFMTVTVRSKKKLYYVASILAFAPVFLLAMNSIGQLELKDFVLVFALVGLVCFYVIKRS